uniref:Uncharacterized protein n=1 Tax=uncultured bacterium BLR12 TaxID=506514 RepID=C0INE6_9BACT|nr:hypothetical protein AKSOIL_0217 [uncultured bacterium BLR12]
MQKNKLIYSPQILSTLFTFSSFVYRNILACI